MNYEIVTNLLYRISKIQETLIQDPPSLPANFWYVISRIFIYASIIFFGICFFHSEKTKKIEEKIFVGIMGNIVGYFFAFFILFFCTVFTISATNDERKVSEIYFAPLELIQLTYKRNEFNTKRNEAIKEEKEILKEINKITNNNPKFSELKSAKNFLMEKEKILKAKYEKENKILEKIMSISKKEILLSVKDYDFLQKLNEDQLKYLTKAIAFRTKTYKNFSELKIPFNEALDSNLPDILQDNTLVENYINSLSEKVDKELITEKL